MQNKRTDTDKRACQIFQNVSQKKKKDEKV